MATAKRPQDLSWIQIYFNARCIPYWALHVGAVVGVALVGFSWSGLALAVALYYARMFFITAGYHRYFSHRTFKTSRLMQFVFAFGAQSSMQKGSLWWAAHHRRHHRHSDTPKDPHSPRQDGFWWSHHGWVLSHKLEKTHWEEIKDLSKYPELVWINQHRYEKLPGLALALALWAFGGGTAVVWGFLVSTVLLWHGTFTINSLAHVIGRVRYKTGDDSKNHFGLALLTMGEGWHNNHHHYQRATCQGFRWWQIDLTWYILRLMSVVGLVWDLHRPPKYIVEGKDKPRKSTCQHVPNDSH